MVSSVIRKYQLNEKHFNFNPRVIILLICINDVQGKELSFKVCNIMKVIG